MPADKSQFSQKRQGIFMVHMEWKNTVYFKAPSEITRYKEYWFLIRFIQSIDLYECVINLGVYVGISIPLTFVVDWTIEESEQLCRLYAMAPYGKGSTHSTWRACIWIHMD